MFGFSTAEMAIVLVIILVVFGAGKLPQVARQLGKGVRDFRSSLDGQEDEPKKQLTHDTINNDNASAPMGGIEAGPPPKTGTTNP